MTLQGRGAVPPRRDRQQLAGPPPATPGSVGLVVTREAPHSVLEVADMCDVNGVMQGDRGYNNPAVLAGDRLLAVNGVAVEMQPIAEVHALLRGPTGTRLEMNLARGRQAFSIRVMRHLPHRGGDLTPRGGPVPNEPVQPVPLGLPAQQTQHVQAATPFTPRLSHAVREVIAPVEYVAPPNRHNAIMPRDAGARPDSAHDNVAAHLQPPLDARSTWAAEIVMGRAGGAKVLLRVNLRGVDDGVENFRSISAAVLQSGPGGVIEVAAGTYEEVRL